MTVKAFLLYWFFGVVVLLFIVTSGASGGAGIAGMSAQLDVNPFPLFIGHGCFIAARALNFCVKQE
jgi:hypothetical protein